LRIGIANESGLKLSAFGLYHVLFGLDDCQDDTYTEGGIEADWAQGSWTLRLSVKRLFDLDHYDLTEIQLGAVRRW